MINLFIMTCAICRFNFNTVCIECDASERQQKNIKMNCSITMGFCGHKYHSHCINKWLKIRPICPLDGRPFYISSPETSLLERCCWKISNLGPEPIIALKNFALAEKCWDLIKMYAKGSSDFPLPKQIREIILEQTENYRSNEPIKIAVEHERKRILAILKDINFPDNIKKEINSPKTK